MTEKNHYYLPQGYHEFRLWERNVTDVPGPNPAAWGLVHGDIDALKTGSITPRAGRTAKVKRVP